MTYVVRTLRPVPDGGLEAEFETEEYADALQHVFDQLEDVAGARDLDGTRELSDKLEEARGWERTYGTGEIEIGGYFVTLTERSLSSFKLEITLGNEAMSQPAQIATALRKAADQIDIGLSVASIIDTNGNVCGRWEIE